MNKEELVTLVRETLQGCDMTANPVLVNFFDDDIDWKKIAEIAVETITNTFDEVPWVQQ